MTLEHVPCLLVSVWKLKVRALADAVYDNVYVLYKWFRLEYKQV